MATVSKDTVSIVDLDKETITTVDMAKKQYSVMTFAQMKEATEKMLAQAQARQKGKSTPPPSGAELNYKVTAKATGQTKTINGINAREVVMEMAAEVTDKDQNSGTMNITMDNWMGTVPGYEEVQAFHRKMGEKMGYAFGSGMSQIAAMRPEALKGFEEAGKEMAKVQGVPVQSIMKMSGAGDGTSDLSAAQQQQQQQPGRQQPPPQVGQTASDAAVGAALGRLGIGGFGRNRNKQQAPPQPPPQGDAPAPAVSNAPATGSGSLMEMTTELTAFSATADSSKFEVPAGFKQVESEMVRRAR
jgi:hypothetical protein